MATGDQLKKLVQSHYKNNDDQFGSLVLQVAAHEAKNGHNELAKEIKKIVDNERKKKNKVHHLNNYSELIEFTEPDVRLNQLFSKEETSNRIKRIITEFKNRNKLAKYNLKNRNKILLVGPPGTGKTMTSSILATEMSLPLGVIRMDKLITKYMGETALKLRDVFNSVNDYQAVYLFDEFDAIGTERTSENDVGEMRRVLNSFLQLLEQSASDSIIIAATNNIQLLDRALFRRFDDIIYYDKPEKAEIEELIKNKIASFAKDIDYKLLSEEAIGLNHSEISQVCLDSIKDAILSDKELVNEEIILNNMKNRLRVYENEV